MVYGHGQEYADAGQCIRLVCPCSHDSPHRSTQAVPRPGCISRSATDLLPAHKTAQQLFAFRVPLGQFYHPRGQPQARRRTARSRTGRGGTAARVEGTGDGTAGAANRGEGTGHAAVAPGEAKAPPGRDRTLPHRRPGGGTYERTVACVDRGGFRL
jgi:hypothetical protein